MQSFGRYVLLELVARGGMAEVWRAAAVGTAGFSRVLAVKRILPHLATQPNFVRMFVDEAKIAAVLNHPNVLQVLDLGQHGGQYFLAMEFVAGRPLSSVVTASLQRGVRVPLPFCVQAVAQALDGLSFAHEKRDSLDRPMKIIHRDVSPQNIMVGFDGTVKLADFGIAKAAQRSSDTEVGAVKGKPGYLAPEQVRADEFDQRIDIYAMGIVLYELLAMQRMRRSADDMKVLVEVMNGTYQRFDELKVDVPAELAAVVYQALEADPQARWQTAAAFSKALHDLLRRNVAGAPPLGEFMHHIFPDEVAAEHSAQQRYAKAMENFAGADAEEISRIIQREGLDAADTARRTRGPDASQPTTLAGSSALVTDAGDAVVESHPDPRAAGLPRKRHLLGLLGVAAALTAAAAAGLSGPGDGTLVISSSPEGARITLGGKLLGVAPVVLEDVAPGEVVVEAALPDMTPAREVVSVLGGQTTRVTLSLKERRVDVALSTVPSGAVVKLDGEPVGFSPVALHLVGAAPVLLTVELEGHHAVEQLLVPTQTPPSLSVALQRVPVAKPERAAKGHRRIAHAAPSPKATPAPAPAPSVTVEAAPSGPGFLALQSKPWAKIFVDGADTGRFTPINNLKVPAGQHTVRLVNEENRLSAEFTVDVAAGATVKVAKNLN